MDGDKKSSLGVVFTVKSCFGVFHLFVIYYYLAYANSNRGSSWLDSILEGTYVCGTYGNASNIDVSS